MALVFRDDKTAHYEDQFRQLKTGRVDNIKILPLGGFHGSMVGVAPVNRRAPADISELIMNCTFNLEYNDVVIFMSDGFSTVLGKVVAGTVHFDRDLDVDQVSVISSSGSNFVIKAGSKLIASGTDYKRTAYNLKIVCRDHKVVVNGLEYKLVRGKPRIVGKRARSVEYYCVDGSIFAQYYKEIFGKDPEPGEELVGMFVAAFTTAHCRLMNNHNLDTKGRSLEVICHWDAVQSMEIERRAFIKKAKQNAKDHISTARFRHAAAAASSAGSRPPPSAGSRPPPSNRTPSESGWTGFGATSGGFAGFGGSDFSGRSSGGGSSGGGSHGRRRPGATASNPMNLDGPTLFRAGGHGEYDASDWIHRHNPRGGHRPGDDDMDEQYSAQKRVRPPASTTSGFSGTRGRGRKKTNVASKRSPSPAPSDATTVKYKTDDDGDGYQSSARIVDLLRDMMDNQSHVSNEFRRILDENSIETNKGLLALMARQVLTPDRPSDEENDHAAYALSELDREKLFRLMPELNDTVMANQENLYEFSIRDILVAFLMQHVDPTYLEEFIKFLINSACRQFMGSIADENRSVRVGGLHAIVTLFRVFYVTPINPV